MNNRPNILQLITPVGFYGAERWVVALANNTLQSEANHELMITVEPQLQDLAIAEKFPGPVHNLELKSRFDLRVLLKAISVIRDRNIDLIHTHGYKSDLIGVFLSKQTRIPCVATPHGFGSPEGLKMKAYLYAGKQALRRADAVAPLSQQLTEQVVRMGVAIEKTFTITNGVDLTEITSDTAARNRKRYKGIGSFVLGYVGRLDENKNVIDLVKAFNEVYKKYPEARLEIVGDGPMRQTLEWQAQQLPSADRITFHGFRSDRLGIMSNFDVFLMTSKSEGIPRCIMEAMALGVPTVAYNIPGVNELVKPGSTGALATLGDWRMLADKTCSLLDDPSTLSKYGHVSAQTIENDFSARRMSTEYLALYDRLIFCSRGGQ